MGTQTGADDVSDPRGHVRLDPAGLKDWIQRLTAIAGASQESAVDFAEAVVEADLRGLATHGVVRVPPYVERIQSGAVSGHAVPTVDRRGAVALVNGHNSIGHHVARVAGDEAVKLSREFGVGVAAARASNHFGFNGFFATQMASSGVVALVVTNGTACIAPPGASQPFLSNNPVSIAAKIDHQRFFEFDAAMSTISRGLVRQAMRTGISLPQSVALDKNGRPTTNPKMAFDGTLVPIGQAKGFGLIFGLDILAGLLSGANASDLVPSKDDSDAPENLGHFLVAFHIEHFMHPEDFARKLADQLDRLRLLSLGTSVPRYPGQRRWDLRARNLEQGVPIGITTYDDLVACGDSLGMPKPSNHVQADNGCR